MAYFTYILINNVIPISIMVAFGVILERAFHLDIRTMSKLNFYLFSPAMMFKMLYESKISVAVLGQVLLFFLVFFLLLYGTVEVVIRIRKYQSGMKSAMRNSVLFYNSGNYAIPLNQLVFVGDTFTMSVQVIIMMMQNLLPNTYGIYAVNSHKSDLKAIGRTILSMPSIYAIPLAFLMRGLSLPIPPPAYTAVNYVSSAFIATALITLGIQLGGMKWKLNLSDVMLSNILRLVIGPALGFLVVLIFGLHGLLAKALILSCSVPTSLSSVLLAVEFDNEPEFASQAVFASTVFSIFTVALVIYLLQFVP